MIGSIRMSCGRTCKGGLILGVLWCLAWEIRAQEAFVMDELEAERVIVGSRRLFSAHGDPEER